MGYRWAGGCHTGPRDYHPAAPRPRAGAGPPALVETIHADGNQKGAPRAPCQREIDPPELDIEPCSAALNARPTEAASHDVQAPTSRLVKHARLRDGASAGSPHRRARAFVSRSLRPAGPTRSTFAEPASRRRSRGAGLEALQMSAHQDRIQDQIAESASAIAFREHA